MKMQGKRNQSLIPLLVGFWVPFLLLFLMMCTSSSQEATGKRLVKTLIEEAYNNQNTDILKEIISTDYIEYWNNVPYEMRGPELIQNLVESFSMVYPDFHITIEELLAEDNKVVMLYLFEGTHGRTERAVQIYGMTVVYIKGEEIIKGYNITDQWTLYQQLGYSLQEPEE
jgi:hypothetical protein